MVRAKLRRDLQGAAAAVILALAMGCGDDQHTAVIAGHRKPCHDAFGQTSCLVVAVDGEASSLFYSDFEGATFQWGIETTLRFHEERVRNPEADGSSIRYVADELLAADVIASGTPLHIDYPAREFPEEGTWFSADGDGLAMYPVRASCTPARCAEVLALVAANQAFGVDFVYTADLATPVEVVAVIAP